MTSNNNGWDDEAAARKEPELYRCRGCGGAFRRPQVEMKKVDGGNMGIFYCRDCMKSLKPEGCLLVAYDDPAQWVYLCVNCPIPELVCDLRSKAPIKVVRKR